MANELENLDSFISVFKTSSDPTFHGNRGFCIIVLNI